MTINFNNNGVRTMKAYEHDKDLGVKSYTLMTDTVLVSVFVWHDGYIHGNVYRNYEKVFEYETDNLAWAFEIANRYFYKGVF